MKKLITYILSIIGLFLLGWVLSSKKLTNRSSLNYTIFDELPTKY